VEGRWAASLPLCASPLPWACLPPACLLPLLFLFPPAAAILEGCTRNLSNPSPLPSVSPMPPPLPGIIILPQVVQSASVVTAATLATTTTPPPPPRSTASAGRGTTPAPAISADAKSLGGRGGRLPGRCAGLAVAAAILARLACSSLG
jgi:hypothetical protein